MPAPEWHEEAGLMPGAVGALYAMVYRAVQESRRRRCAVLICPPIAGEHTHCLRLLVHLAWALASQGWTACRLDCFGNGESEGDFADCDLESCTGSVLQVASHLRTSCPDRPLVLLGLRTGGLFAALAAARLRWLAGLVLVDPVLDARSYLRELRYAAAIGRHRGTGDDLPGSRPGEESLEVAGFAFSSRFMDQLASLPPLALTGLPEVLGIVTGRGPEAERLQAALGTAGVIRSIAGTPRYWTKKDMNRAPALEREVLTWMERLESRRGDV